MVSITTGWRLTHRLKYKTLSISCYTFRVPEPITPIIDGFQDIIDDEVSSVILNTKYRDYIFEIK